MVGFGTGKDKYAYLSSHEGARLTPSFSSASPCAPSCAPPSPLSDRPGPSYDARGVDTWSAGVCLFAMVTGALPFGGGGSSKLEDTLGAVQTAEPIFPKHLSPQLVVRKTKLNKYFWYMYMYVCSLHI